MGTRIKATQLRTSSVSDLTNTTWIFNTTRATTSLSEMYINAIMDNQSVNNPYFAGIKTISQGFISFYWDRRMSGSEAWVEIGDYLNTPIQITITGGNDVTNSTLITWLQTNATQVTPPEPSGTNHTHLGSLSIIKKHFGDLEVIKETLNGVTIYEKGSPAPSSYTIHIIDASPYGLFIYDGQDNTGTLLAQTYGAGNETDVICTTGYLYFKPNLGGNITAVIVNSGDATATNPSTITGNANLTIYATGGDG